MRARSGTESSGFHPTSLPLRLATAVAGVALACGLAVFYFASTPPERAFAPFQSLGDYPIAPMRKAMQVQGVSEEHEAIVRLGSRFMGQPGWDKAVAYVRAAYERAGLEIYEQEFDVVAPKTAYREILRVNDDLSEPLREVVIYPFMPNQMQPVVAPGDGITGKLILLDEATLNTRERFDDCIGLIDSREGHFARNFGFDWTRYANLGMKALIVSHSEGLEKAPWIAFSRHRGSWAMVSGLPVNYVRLAATKEIFHYLGETIRVRVRVDYSRERSISLFGVLRAAEPAAEALLVTAPYDSPSFLPDRAPGVLPALAPAVQLQLLEGLLPYRDTLKRDIIFAAFSANTMATEGHNHILQVIRKNEGIRPERSLEAGSYDAQSDTMTGVRMDGSDPRQTWLAERWEKNERRRHRVGEIIDLFVDEDFAVNPEASASALQGLGQESRNLLREQFTYVIKTVSFELSEPLIQAKVAVVREFALGDIESAAYGRYYAAKRDYEKALAASGYRMVNLLREKADLAARYRLRSRLQERMEELRHHHESRHGELERNVKLLNLLSAYERIGIFSTRLAPAPPGTESETEVVRASFDDNQVSFDNIMQLMSWSKRRLQLTDRLEIPSRETADYIDLGVNGQAAGMWGGNGYPSFFIFNSQRTGSYERYSNPFDLASMYDLGSLENTFAVVGETLLSLAHGNIGLLPTQIIRDSSGMTYGGRVLATGIGQSIVPDYPVKDALVACRSRPDRNMWGYAGYFVHPILITDVYGRFEAPHNFNDFPILWNVSREGGGISPVAAKIGPDGLISHIKNEGEAAQRAFRSLKIPYRQAENVTIVLFRASPVTLLDLTNPQTLDRYTGVEMIQSEGLAPFERICTFLDWHLLTTFLEPDRRFYIKLQSGAAENELVKVTRAFMTNVDDTADVNLDGELGGIGYLPAESPFLVRSASETAHSMAYVNGRRLDLQNLYGMADSRTNDYHTEVLTRLEEIESPGLSQKAATRKSREAVTYATLSHPVLRRSIFEAVAGIIWYLALLVPFIFFFEKLVFCFSDVRRQIAAQAVIFIIVFSLFRLLHPAFEMVRSSLMILLGFIIILISSAITVLFSSKFQENLEEVRRKKGKVTAAEVDKLGAMATAFLLGLNNMHRRRMRTGLTCATLTVITFAIICFTSAENDLVEEARAVGKAPYQGMLIKRELMEGFYVDELKPFYERFADRYAVCPRRMSIGGESGREGRRLFPQFEMFYQTKGSMRKVEFDAIIQFEPNEPMRHQIRFLTDNAWFDERDESDAGDLKRVFIPDVMADRLNITVRDVETGESRVWISSANNESGWATKEFLVGGIFDAEAYDNMTDLDGHRILPFDIRAMESVASLNIMNRGAVASEYDPKVPAEKVILARYEAHPGPPLWGRIFSLAVAMPDSDYREARQVIESYMEQTAKPLSYGIDGVAYRGRRARESSLAGFIDLLIPLVIAALTVLNTMRGSVYERRDEIYVYNSVGIAPVHVFLMFMAEAAVYAVVGSVLGYILSQGNGRILTILDLTGGLNMTFSSITVIYSSLAIFGAVFLSTWFPAKAAMEIAKTAEEAGWDLPEPEGNRLQLEMPFSFRPRERLGVLAFIDRWVRNHGEGGAGRFFSDHPEIALDSDRETGPDWAYLPYFTATIWLKPFDLAVSQRLLIAMPRNPETGEYEAQVTLEHLSGTRESWLRLNRGFVAQIRRHFLHWRAVGLTEREELVAETRERLSDGRTVSGRIPQPTEI